MNNFFYALPQRLRDNRVFVFLLLVIFVVAGLFGVGKLWRDDSIESWLGEDSPVIRQQRQLEQVFGNNEDLFIIVEARDGDIFSPDSLRAFHRLHDKLQSSRVEIQKDSGSPLGHIREVLSLVNVPVNDVNGDNLYTRPFISHEVPARRQALDALREKAIGDPDLRKRFVSVNSRYASITIKTDFGRLSNTTTGGEAVADEVLSLTESSLPETLIIEDLQAGESAADDPLKRAPRNYKEYAKFSTAVKGLVEAAAVEPQLSVHYAGLPELVAFHVFIGTENRVIFSGLFLIMTAVLWVLFRHVSVVLWCMSIPMLTLVLTLGVQGWIGLPTSDLTAAMALLLIIISVADAVHIVASYRYYRLAGYKHPQAMAVAMSKAGLSCLLTSLTTMVAFLSLYLVKPNMPAAIFGLFTTLGLGLAFLLTVILIPLLLDLWRPKFEISNQTGNVVVKSNHRIFVRLPAFVARRPVLTLLLSMLLGVPIMAGTAFLKVDSNPLESFDKSSYLRQAFDIADRYMGGTQNIDFMVDTGQVDALYDARVLKRMDRLEMKMRQRFPDLIAVSVSITDALKKINQQFHNNDPAYYKLPDHDAELSQLLFLFNNVSPEERRKLVGEDFDTARIAFGLKNGGSTQYIELMNAANKWGREFFIDLKSDYPDLKVVTAGGVVIFMTLFDRITDSQIICFLITLLVVLVTLFFIFRSWKFGLFAIIPNLTPVLVTFGAMGWLGITLNNVTMIIAPIILGIAVDDTIHFVYRLRILLAQGKGVDEAIQETFSEVGKAITYTTLILSAGLLTLLYSSNSQFRAFGYLSALAFFTALLAEFTITPALIKLFFVQKTSPQRNDEQTKEGASHEYTL